MNNEKKINSSSLTKLARLARLEINKDSEVNLIKDLNEIIGFIDQLNEVNTDNVQPLGSVTGHDLPLRKDKVSDGEINDKILENAPEKISGYFVVPKVVE